MSVEKLRSLTLGAPTKGRVENITVSIGDEKAEIEVRAPSLKQQQTITRLATDKEGKVDSHKLAAYSLIACAYSPDENVPVFSQKDFDTVMGFGMTGWVGQILAALGRVATNDPKVLEENFEKTAGE